MREVTSDTEKGGVLLRKVWRRSPIRTGNDREGSSRGTNTPELGGRGLQVIHTLTRRGLYHSGFSSSSKHLSHSLGLWLSHFVSTLPRNLGFFFTASSNCWIGRECVLEWDGCEKGAAPPSISSPRATPFLAGGSSFRCRSLPQLARLDRVLQTLLLCRLEAGKPVLPGWAPPSPDYAWRHKRQVPAHFDIGIKCRFTSHQALRTYSAFISYHRETHGRSNLQNPQPGHHTSSHTHPTPSLLTKVQVHRL